MHAVLTWMPRRDGGNAAPSHDWRPAPPPAVFDAPVDGVWAVGMQGAWKSCLQFVSGCRINSPMSRAVRPSGGGAFNVSVVYNEPVQPYYGVCWNVTDAVGFQQSNFSCARC